MKQLSKADLKTLETQIKDDEILSIMTGTIFVVKEDLKKGSNDRQLLTNTIRKLNHIQKNYKLVKKT